MTIDNMNNKYHIHDDLHFKIGHYYWTHQTFRYNFIISTITVLQDQISQTHKYQGNDNHFWTNFLNTSF